VLPLLNNYHLSYPPVFSSQGTACGIVSTDLIGFLGLFHCASRKPAFPQTAPTAQGVSIQASSYVERPFNLFFSFLFFSLPTPPHFGTTSVVTLHFSQHFSLSHIAWSTLCRPTVMQSAYHSLSRCFRRPQKIVRKNLAYGSHRSVRWGAGQRGVCGSRSSDT